MTSSANIYFVIVIITLVYPPCHSECEDYYFLLEKYVEYGIYNYRPYSLGNSATEVLDVDTNRTVDALDLNCVINLSCDGIVTFAPPRETTSVTRKSTSVHYSTPSKIIESTTQPVPTEFSTTETTATNADKTVDISTTEVFASSPTTNKINPDITTNNDNETTATTTDNIIHISTTEVFASAPTTSGIISDITTQKNNATSTEEIDVTTKSERNEPLLINGISTNVTNTTINGHAEKYKQVNYPAKVAAGVLGTITTGGIIYALKIFIERFLQSGVYRLPDP